MGLRGGLRFCAFFVALRGGPRFRGAFLGLAGVALASVVHFLFLGLAGAASSSVAFFFVVVIFGSFGGGPRLWRILLRSFGFCGGGLRVRRAFWLHFWPCGGIVFAFLGSAWAAPASVVHFACIFALRGRPQLPWRMLLCIFGFCGGGPRFRGMCFHIFGYCGDAPAWVAHLFLHFLALRVRPLVPWRIFGQFWGLHGWTLTP